ncbi:MAG: hypothetical protein GX748_12200, partial [Lentisphaerae bacterium]|nr:hypothetical protein [Lentisphaerota bacterium]
CDARRFGGDGDLEWNWKLEHGGGPGDTLKNGGHGGGVVRIEATGGVTVNGSILANGGAGVANHGAGGAGGAIHIVCDVLSGGGTISANGGLAQNWSGGGGGGCIAIAYNPAAQAAAALPGLSIVALGGKSTSAVTFPNTGGVGTLWFPDNQFLTRVTASDVVRLGGQWLDPSFTAWNIDSLAMNNAWLRFPHVGFTLNVTNNLSITGTDRDLTRLELTNGVLNCGGDITLDKAALVLHTDNTTGPEVFCDGNFKLTNLSLMYLYCGTNSAAAPDTTALVDVGGTMTVDATSWVYPVAIDAFAPAAPLFEVGNLFVGTGSGFDASIQGWSGATNKSTIGFGPGKGGTQGGAGHGGKGGGPNGGAAYGSASNPVTLGSGGGAGDNSVNTSARGGGALRINATGKVAVNGSLLANGGNGTANHGGGGSGGSVNILCDTFWGTNGVISANGGTGANTTGGGGAGGRIAIRYNAVAQGAVPVPGVTVSANGGLGGRTVTYTRRGDLGTIYFPDASMLLAPSGFAVHTGQLVVPGFTAWTLD